MHKYNYYAKSKFKGLSLLARQLTTKEVHMSRHVRHTFYVGAGVATGPANKGNREPCTWRPRGKQKQTILYVHPVGVGYPTPTGWTYIRDFCLKAYYLSILLSCARATQHQKDGHTFVTIALGCLKAKVTNLCPFLWCGHTPMSIRCVYYHAVAL